MNARLAGCATCHRTYDMDDRDARQWIARPDDRGLMCPVCQRRERQGQPLDRTP